MVQLHAAGGAAERAGAGRGAHGLAAAARPAPHGGGALGRGQRGEAAPRGEAARGAPRAGGGGGGGGRAARQPAAAARAHLVHAAGGARPAAAAPPVQRPLLGLQAAAGVARAAGHLLTRCPRRHGLMCEFKLFFSWSLNVCTYSLARRSAPL